MQTRVASYLLGAIVSVLKALGTRVGAQGARPGEGRGRAFYRETACTPAVWVAAISDPIGSCSGGLVHFGLASQQSVGVCR